MEYSKIRRDLELFNKNELPKKVAALKDHVFAQLDQYALEHPGLNAYQLRAAQYACIAESFEPVIHEDFPFYYELGVLYAFGDGCYTRGGIQACGWLAQHNNHLFIDPDPHRFELFNKNIDN
ncbi:MAG: hypothetical protein IIY04_05885, partial [Oscillospiraceae bacterium]|nr:hypothetical protein [Oscillospiraceae bacterium]